MESERYTLSAAEAWRLYQLLEHLNEFLHNPAHFSDPKQVEAWLGRGTYAELRHAYYDMIGPWFPVEETTGEVPPPPNASIPPRSHE